MGPIPANVYGGEGLTHYLTIKSMFFPQQYQDNEATFLILLDPNPNNFLNSLIQAKVCFLNFLISNPSPSVSS